MAGTSPAMTAVGAERSKRNPCHKRTSSLRRLCGDDAGWWLRASAALADFGVVALGVPFVDDVVDRLDVALGVECHLAQDRVPFAGLDHVHDLLEVGGAGLGD